MINISKNELVLFLNKIIDFIPDKINISEDNYWLIGSDTWTDFSKESSPDVGSLRDDWYFLLQLINENREVSSSDLDRLSSIFRAISQEINPI
ncbi:hypothetical protein [Emticicia sp. TH156]|uniref:hypothetical protein n=1 Tax=Emticicia sp. TH156 TaxID=2067454 RepID=UPI000C78A046|nr:hypothetical protein [Emticicia sp. TH156]PLK42150.1 hypothetical protein C0V77_22460 [Emticicia sp. TH156]